MLLSVYILYVCLTFIFFCSAICLVAYGPARVKENDSEQGKSTSMELRGLMIVPFLILMMLAWLTANSAEIGSFNINKEFCDPVITSTIQSYNTTTYTNEHMCTRRVYNLDYLSPIYVLVKVLIYVLVLFYVLIWVFVDEIMGRLRKISGR